MAKPHELKVEERILMSPVDLDGSTPDHFEGWGVCLLTFRHLCDDMKKLDSVGEWKALIADPNVTLFQGSVVSTRAKGLQRLKLIGRNTAIYWLEGWLVRPLKKRERRRTPAQIDAVNRTLRRLRALPEINYVERVPDEPATPELVSPAPATTAEVNPVISTAAALQQALGMIIQHETELVALKGRMTRVEETLAVTATHGPEIAALRAEVETLKPKPVQPQARVAPPCRPQLGFHDAATIIRQYQLVKSIDAIGLGQVLTDWFVETFPLGERLEKMRSVPLTIELTSKRTGETYLKEVSKHTYREDAVRDFMQSEKGLRYLADKEREAERFGESLITAIELN